MTEPFVKTVTITLTQQCNLDCIYCYEHHKTKHVMDLATAKKIIDYELENCSGYDRIEFDLFGGEPFLAFDMIKEITSYICEKKRDIHCTVFAATNGTLIHGEIQDWLKEHAACFVCGLSLDGTRDMHNVNRSNSYDLIDLDFFLELYPGQEIKMTISQETLPDLAEGVLDLHKKGFLVSCNLAYGIDWTRHENVNILDRELHKMIDFYLEHPEVEPCSMLEMGISNAGLTDSRTVRYCGAGRDMCAYDIDGTNYPCQFFMPLSIGKDKATEVKFLSFPDDYLPDELIDEKSRSCVIRSVCPNCMGANYAATGSIYKRDEALCKLTKIIIKARSYFRAKQWELGQINDTAENTQALLRAIIRIQEELTI